MNLEVNDVIIREMRNRLGETQSEFAARYVILLDSLLEVRNIVQQSKYYKVRKRKRREV